MKKYELIGVINDALGKFGFQISAYGPSSPKYQFRNAINDPDISIVIDAGANVGQYGKLVRRIRKDVSIFSFEPQARAFDRLAKTAILYKDWHVYHLGLGSSASSMLINISENDQCSSLLSIGEAQLLAVPNSKTVGVEQVKIETLDLAMKDVDGRKFLKIDCQGYEAEIIRGSTQVLKSTKYVQMEASLVPLYQSAPTISQIIDQMDGEGFELMTILPGFSDAINVRMLQVDLVFIRKK